MGILISQLLNEELEERSLPPEWIVDQTNIQGLTVNKSHTKKYKTQLFKESEVRRANLEVTLTDFIYVEYDEKD